MENKMQIFVNETFGKVRVVMIDGEPWFVGKDVAKALGYQRATKAIQDHVDSEDKDAVPIEDSIGRSQRTPIISESGLYSLILSSKLPSAKRFKRWVTSEILPSLRKHNAYLTDELLEEVLQSPELAYQLFYELQEEKNKVEILAKGIVELEPKARYCEAVLECNKAIPVTIIAKDYGYTAIAFNRLLNALEIQFRAGGAWLLNKKYANKGYTKTKTYYINENECTINTYWTQSGRLFLYEFLRKFDILPLNECIDCNFMSETISI